MDPQKLSSVFFQLSKACEELGTLLSQTSQQPISNNTTPQSESELELKLSIASPVVKKQQKKERDPNAPKKPLSPYMIFFQENYQNLAKQNEGKGVIEIGKLISELWKKVDHSEYEKKAKIAKENYTNLMVNYNATKSNTSPIIIEESKKREQEEPANENKQNKKNKKIEPVAAVKEEKVKSIEKAKKEAKIEVSVILPEQKTPSSPLITDSQSTVMSTVDPITGEKKKEKKKHHHKSTSPSK